jgi:hypothetical protein
LTREDPLGVADAVEDHAACADSGKDQRGDVQVESLYNFAMDVNPLALPWLDSG